MSKNKPGYDAEYKRRLRAKETPEQAKARKDANAERGRKRRAEKKTGRGVGAPRIVEDELTESHTISMPESYWGLVKDLGGGYYSAGIRLIVEDWKRKKGKVKK